MDEHRIHDLFEQSELRFGVRGGESASALTADQLPQALDPRPRLGEVPRGQSEMIIVVAHAVCSPETRTRAGARLSLCGRETVSQAPAA